MRVVLPAPVEPAIMVRLPGRKSWLKEEMISLPSDSYLNVRFLMRMPGRFIGEKLGVRCEKSELVAERSISWRRSMATDVEMKAGM